MAMDSPAASFRIVFEDDGETGYLYAYDRAGEAQHVLDAVMVYAGPDMPTTSVALSMRWSDDGLKGGLWMAERLSAVVDFEARHAYTRTNFPESAGVWGVRAPWRDTLSEFFD